MDRKPYRIVRNLPERVVRFSGWGLPGGNESGFVLVTVISLLLILTIIGIAAMGTSRVTSKIVGNSRVSRADLVSAESGMELGKPAIRLRVSPGGEIMPVPTGMTIKSNLDLQTPYDTDALDTLPDMTMDAGTVFVRVDMDYMTMKNVGDAEFGGETSLFIENYKVNSDSADLTGGQGAMGGIYRYIRQ